MARKPVAEQPMTPAARRRKSDADKLLRGEMRITQWINAEATIALLKLTEGQHERGAIKKAVEQALIKAAARLK